jgi:hypothetical protein
MTRSCTPDTPAGASRVEYPRLRTVSSLSSRHERASTPPSHAPDPPGKRAKDHDPRHNQEGRADEQYPKAAQESLHLGAGRCVANWSADDGIEQVPLLRKETRSEPLLSNGVGTCRGVPRRVAIFRAEAVMMLSMPMDPVGLESPLGSNMTGTLASISTPLVRCGTRTTEVPWNRNAASPRRC